MITVINTNTTTSMSDARLVKDYMQTHPKSVSVHGTMRDAISAMIKGKTNGLVVVDENNTVVGILSSWDIIELVVPDYLEDDLHLAAFEADATFNERIEEMKDTPVTKFMTKQVHVIKKDDSLMHAATLLSEFKIRQLPVVEDNQKLVGYINRTDIKRAIGDVLGIKEESR